MKKSNNTFPDDPNEPLDEFAGDSIHPLRDGDRYFYDDPSDIAASMDNAVGNIEAGQPYITKYTLPYLEIEAIARFKKQTGYRPIVEPDRLKEPEAWRAKWVNEALHANSAGDIKGIGRAGLEVLLACSRLRAAMDEGNPEMIAARSMMLVCEVLMGGYMPDAEVKKKSLTKVQKKLRPFEDRKGKRALDPKTELYEHYAKQFPRSNRKAVDKLRLEAPRSDDGKSPFFWKGRELFDRKVGSMILVDDMVSQLQKARQRMTERAAEKTKGKVS